MKTFAISIIFFCALIFSVEAHSQIKNLPFTGDTAGIVNGRIITKAKYVDMFLAVSLERKDMGKTKSSPEEELKTTHQITWERLVMNDILEDSIEKKGIVVSDDEARSTLENDPPEAIMKNFRDSSGKFHKFEYLQALRDPRNDTIVRNVINAMKPELRKQKLSNILMSSVNINDEELWSEYKKKKDATKQKFETEKEALRKDMLHEKQMSFIDKWVTSAKENAKIIDYRTVK